MARDVYHWLTWSLAAGNRANMQAAWALSLHVAITTESM